MPLRVYEPVEKPCRLCGTGFEKVEPANSAPLQSCPRCGAAVRAIGITRPTTPKIIKPLSTSEAKAAGFTVFKKTGGGEYEKQ